MSRKEDSARANNASQPEQENPARRKMLQTSIAGAGLVAAAQTEWAKPVINSIILPAHAQTSGQTIAAIAVETGILSTLVSVLTQGQVDALNGPGPLTVFAPINDAFAAIQSTVDTLTAAEIETVVNYHVVAGSVTFADIPATTGAAPSLVTTVEASNGTVFVIDQVLLPA